MASARPWLALPCALAFVGGCASSPSGPAPAYLAGPAGADAPVQVTGRVLARGDGIAGCQVKLTPMRQTVLGLLQWEEAIGSEFVAITDETGAFEIRGVPPGAYRVKWAIPGATHWVKRLKEEPDVLVAAEGIAVVGDIETARRIR